MLTGGNRTAKEIKPIFCAGTGCYEVYYLQIPDTAQYTDLSALQAQMKKGIARLDCCYQREIQGTNTYLVYEGGFAGWLRKNGLEAIWQKLWNLPLYREYKEPHNLKLLLDRIPKSQWPGNLVILGEAPGMEDWLKAMAKYMKKITWYSLSMARGFTEIQENLLEEYGLMLDWKRSLQPKSPEPAMVLDYCGKENVFVWDIPSGSIWVDMTSLENRRHAVEDRETGIQYTSLNRFWREEMIKTLDTVNQILYNT